MKKNVFLLFLGLAAALTFPVQAAELPKRIILIGWDGVSRSSLSAIMADERILEDTESRTGPNGETLPNRDFMPSLKSIISNGGIAEINISEGTETKGGWSQILTGYRADVTGVFNIDYAKPIPKGFSIFGRLHDFFGNGQSMQDDNVFNVMITGKAANIGTVDNGPFAVEKQFLDFQRTDKDRKQQEVSLLAEEAINVYASAHRAENLFAFIHFAAPDHDGHHHGEDSISYRKAIELDDYYTGKIIKILEQLDLFDDTIVMVTADHGFDETYPRYSPWTFKKNQPGHGHGQAPFVFIAANKNSLLQRSGNRYDVAPTILEAFGIDVSELSPSLSGNSLTKSYLKSKTLNTVKSQITKTFLISWSGANRERIKDLVNSGSLPNLQNLIQQGCLVDIDMTNSIHGVKGIDVVSGLASLLTGYAPETTGYFSRDMVKGIVPKGYTIMERLRQHYHKQYQPLSSDLTTAVIMAKDTVLDADAKGGKSSNPISMFFENSRDDIDFFDINIEKNQVVLQKALQIASVDGSLFAFIHFTYPENAAHAFGEASEQYRLALIESDIALGKIMNGLRNGDNQSDTWIYVTATNGFEKQDALAPFSGPGPDQGYSTRMGVYVFLATNDPKIQRLRGIQLDIAPTILSRAGILLGELYPVLPGQSLTETASRWRMQSQKYNHWLPHQ